MTQTVDELQLASMDWFRRAFGELDIFTQMFAPPERAVRLFEEVVETTQTLGVPLDKLVHTLLYVYARPVEPDVHVEIGGTFVTTCLLAQSLGERLSVIATRELDRAETIVEKARVSAVRKVRDGTSFAPTTHSELITRYAVDYLAARDESDTLRAAYATVVADLQRLRAAGTHEHAINGNAAIAEDTLRNIMRPRVY